MTKQWRSVRNDVHNPLEAAHSTTYQGSRAWCALKSGFLGSLSLSSPHSEWPSRPFALSAMISRILPTPIGASALSDFKDVAPGFVPMTLAVEHLAITVLCVAAETSSQIMIELTSVATNRIA